MNVEPSSPNDSESCCGPSSSDVQLCGSCGEAGVVVGVDIVRPHRRHAVDGDWQYCRTEQCAVVYFVDGERVNVDSVVTQVGTKATAMPTPVCFCFAHTTEDLAADLAANSGVSEIKVQIKAAVAINGCACAHLNPSGECCLPDVHRALKNLACSDPVL